MLRRLCGLTDNPELFGIASSYPLNVLNTPEFQLQNGPPGSPRSEASNQSSQLSDNLYDARHPSVEFGCALTILRDQKKIKHNAQAFVSRFVRIICKPADLAPLILDTYTLWLSLFSSARESEVEFLYPFSSITKRRSGRLARLILDQSKNVEQFNVLEVNDSTVTPVIDPPCVAVINLDEVPQDVIKRGYTIPADVHGFMIMIMIFDILPATCLYIFFPVNTATEVRSGIMRWVGESFYVAWVHWSSLLLGLCILCSVAVFFGDGVLVLVRRPGSIARSSAVFLDHEFTAILTGSPSVVEAIAESSFSLIHPISFPLPKTVPQWGQCLLLKASCSGCLLALFTGGCLAFHPSSLLTASAPLFPAFVIACIYSLPQLQELPPFLKDAESLIYCIMTLWIFFPSLALFSAYHMVLAKELFMGGADIKILQNAFFLAPLIMGGADIEILQSAFFFTPLVSFVIFLILSRDFHMRTTKFFDILGNPPVRRWKFDTLAAAATFQCLVLCHGITRPIKLIDTLALLDTFIPDQTDVWTAWKNRVADRIAHEVEISFAPTLPTFGDLRQKRLKELLDQAQVGYDAYRNFYDRHVPLYST